MKTSTKWIIGIVITLLAVCVVLGSAAVAATWIYRSNWQLETRAGQLWSDDQDVTPWYGAPMQPGQGMWMHPTRGVNGVFLGLFTPLRIMGVSLLCLGFLALLVIGIILLVRRSGGAQAPAPAPEPVAAPAPVVNESPTEGTPSVATTGVCPNCARSVDPDWSHCPYCGAPQA